MSQTFGDTGFRLRNIKAVDIAVGETFVKAWVGKSVVAIGAIHLLFGVVVLGDLLVPAVRAGLFNTISASTPPERNMAYWFLMVGIVTLMLGGLIGWVERAGIQIPRFLPWGFLLLTVIGCVMSPASGFWLLWVPTIGLFLKRRAAWPESAAADIPETTTPGHRTSAST